MPEGKRAGGGRKKPQAASPKPDDEFVVTLQPQQQQPKGRRGGQQSKRQPDGAAGSPSADICRNYLAGRCSKGERCQRVHEPAGIPQTNQQKKGKPADDEEVVCVSPTVTISRERTVSRDDGKKAKDVCKNFLAGRCANGEKCHRLHVQPASKPDSQKQKEQKSKGDRKKSRDQPQQEGADKGKPDSQKQKNGGDGKKVKDQREQQKKQSKQKKQGQQHGKQAEPKQPKKKQEAKQEPDQGSAEDAEDAERAAQLQALAAQAFERMGELKRQKSRERLDTPSQPSRTQSTQSLSSESSPDNMPSPPLARSSSEPQRSSSLSPNASSPTSNTPSGFNGKEELQKALAGMEAWEVAELVTSALTRAAGGPLPLGIGGESTAAGAETPQMEAAEYRRVISAMMIEDARVICTAEGIDAAENASVEELRQLLLDHFGCSDEDMGIVAEGQTQVAMAGTAEGEGIQRNGDEDEEDAPPSAEAAARRRKLLMMEPTDGEFMLDPTTLRVSSAEQA